MPRSSATTTPRAPRWAGYALRITPCCDNVLTIADQLEKRIAAQKAWEADKQDLFENPALPEDAPKVRFQTKLGSFEIGLYSDRAPKHVENFLKLCREGFYVGTKFYRVQPGYMIEGGDPNTKEGDTATWGQGGPGYTVESEKTGLSHFEGVLSAQPGENGDSSGSRFTIATGPLHYFNQQRTVFGVITSGMDVVEQIDVDVDGLEDPASGRPTDPIEIEATEVL